jgi:nitroreductase
MDVLKAINDRYSVRRFLDRVPEAKTVETIIKAAMRAPSAGNLQPWHFYVVTNTTVKQCLARAALNQKHILKAPLAVVVCVEPERSATRYGDRGRYLYCIQDAAAATENLLLAATRFGLGGCWVGAFDEEAVAECIAASPGRRPVAIVPLGYPDGPPKRSKRYGFNEMVTVIT